jgi:hypothetical protein
MKPVDLTWLSGQQALGSSCVHLSAGITMHLTVPGFFFFFLDFLRFFETGFLCIALAVLELTYSVDQTGLKLRNLPASASQVPNGGTKGVRHHCPISVFLNVYSR